MNLKLKLLALVFCGFFLSGCVVSKAKLDESLAKCSLLENDLRSKEQDLDKNKNQISELEAANKTLVAATEKTKQVCSEELTKAKSTQEQTDAELLKSKGQLAEKENELVAVKTEVLTKNKELLTVKEEMSKQLLAKDKETDDLIYRVREIQSRAEALLEKIKTIQ